MDASARQRLGIVDVEKADPAQWTGLDLAVGERLQAALEDLPVETRESVWLRVVDELPYDEIASRQGCSLTAARQRVSRGMRRLAVVMGGT